MTHASRLTSMRGLAALASVAAAVVVVTLSASSPAPSGAPQGVARGHEARAGEVLVKFGRATDRATISQVAGEIDADRERPVGGAGVHLFHSRRFTADELVQRLSRRGNVAYVEPNYIVRALQLPTDPQFAQLWGLLNVGQAVNGGLPGTPGADIKAADAWQVSTGSRTVAVGVIDTGIDYTHPDLVSNVWSAPTSFTVTIGGTALTCGAGTHGFNAIDRTCDPMDDHNHGTHVSGTIGAAANNGVGVAGINWATSIIAAKFLGADGSGTTSDAIDAIEFLIQTKAAFAASGGANVRVLSNSWGDDVFSQALLDEITRANDHDMLFVAAAGNNGLPNDFFPMYPASYQAPNVVAVAATDSSDRRAYFSNYGANTVHLGAPGVDILSTTIGNTYSFFSGTSMATPHVSGAAALVLSACTLDTSELKAQLLNTVDQVASLKGATITGGRLNVDRALRACTAPPEIPAGLVAMSGNAQVSLTWMPASGATTYNVKRALASGGPYITVGAAATTSYLDSPLTNDIVYYYVVSAVNPLGESANSPEVSATPRVPADLIVAALTVPFTAGAGGTIQVSDTTRNQGGGAAPASATRFYLSKNIGLDASDLLLEGGHAVPFLAPGASSTGSSTLTMPAGLAAGTYYVIAVADADGVVVETSENNNVRAGAVTVGPDLALTTLQAPGAVAAGALITVTDTVKNVGAGAAPASVTRFYVSANASFDAADTVLDGSRAVPALAAGASSAGSTTLRMPESLTVGVFYLIARADADNAVSEVSKANNTASRAIQTGPDLTIAALSGPSASGAGATITVNDTTRNDGPTPAAASTTKFYLSRDPAFDALDQVLGGRAVTPLAPGESSTASTSMTLPPSLPTATYYVIARADADAVVNEGSEANNVRATAVAIGPDLVMSALVVATSVPAGSPFTATDTVKNQGGGSAEPSVTRFYLSTNMALDAGDILLDAGRTVPALAAGALSSGSASLTIPAGTAAGTYYLIAKADGNDAVSESSETNNTIAKTVQVGCDLVVAALTLPYSAVSGGTLVVTDTTRNQGTATAPASVTRFYLSTNLALDAGDLLLPETRAVPALDAGASSVGSTSLTIPAGLAAGNYFVIAKADADNSVIEGSETNNTRAGVVRILAGPPGP